MIDLTGLATVCLSACATPEATPRPATDLELYAELRHLRGVGFSCLRATRPGGQARPSDERLREATRSTQLTIREELVRREGEEAVIAVERAGENEGHDPLWTGRCSVTDADHARERYRHALNEMQRRLGFQRVRVRAGATQ